MSELYTTGVPLPYECVYAGKIGNPKTVETALHHAFSNSRINPSRAFFDIDESQAIVLLKLITNEDITPIISNELKKVNEVSKNASKKYIKSRRPSQNFVEISIAIGETLTSLDGQHTCTVAEEKKVNYNGVIISLNRLTRKIKELDHDIQPSPHWFYNGKSVKEIYNAF
jgi:hypothetical protein